MFLALGYLSFRLRILVNLCCQMTIKFFLLRGSGPEQADTLSLTIVCLITYLLTLNFQLFVHLEIFALIVHSMFNNLKSL